MYANGSFLMFRMTEVLVFWTPGILLIPFTTSENSSLSRHAIQATQSLSPVRSNTEMTWGILTISSWTVSSVHADQPHVLEAQPHVVDAGTVSLDDPFGLEVLDPLYEGRRMDVQLLRELPVGALTGPAKKFDYTFVQFVVVG